MKIKQSELKKLISEAIETEMQALLKEGYTQEQLDEIDFSKVGNFFKGAARGVKDLAVDTKKNYFDNSDLNLESEIKKLTKIYMTLSDEVADLTENLSSMKQQLRDLQKTIKEKKSQLEKFKKERGSDPYFKKYSHEDRYKNDKKPVSKKETKPTSEPEKTEKPIDVNKDASTFQRDEKSGQRFRRKLEEIQMRTDLTTHRVEVKDGNEVKKIPYNQLLNSNVRYLFNQIVNKEDITFELAYSIINKSFTEYFHLPEKYKSDIRLFKLFFNYAGGDALINTPLKYITFDMIKYTYSSNFKIPKNTFEYISDKLVTFPKEQYIEIIKLAYKKHGDSILELIPRAYQNLFK